MEKTGDDASTKFISALIKSLQTLCHGYLDFQNGIEIIGHINLNVDKGNSLDYILKEKVCKNAENSTLFISNSFHAEPKPDEEVSGKQGQAGNQSVNSEASMVEGSTKVSSAISSISSALTGVRDKRRESSGGKDFDSSYVHHRTAKRKASSDQNSDVCPAKMPSHHDVSHLSTDSPYRPNSSSPVDSKLSLQELQTADGEVSETMLPQTASVTDNTDLGVNLAGSVLEPVENQSSSDLAARDEDSDGDLEVTFIKEEYVEGDRSCEFDNPSQQYVGGPHDRNSEGMPDPSVFPVALHSGTASSTYVPSTHDHGALGQQYQGVVPSQPQPGPSGTRGPPPLGPLSPRSADSQDHPSSSDSPLASASGAIASFVSDPGAALSPQTIFYQEMAHREKNFLCDSCDARFASDSGLWKHKNRVHLKKATYICPFCGKGYFDKIRHEDHIYNVHNKTKSHKCPYCPSWFAYKTSLYPHIRDKHGRDVPMEEDSQLLHFNKKTLDQEEKRNPQ